MFEFLPEPTIYDLCLLYFVDGLYLATIIMALRLHLNGENLLEKLTLWKKR